MVRLYLFAEGRTEQTFANTVLQPHLAERHVYMQNAVLVANAHKKQNVQLHEYEAYLFVNISVLSNYYPDEQQAITRLHESSETFASPELIDDGTKTAPSKRIIDELPRYERDKATVGVQAAKRIGLSAIRRKCPHFSGWLERLECLDARGEG